MQFHYPPGATPLDADEIQDLIPSHISLHSELNEWESINILEAETWCFSIKHRDILTIAFTQQLHKKMFCNTWRWAGKFRKTNKNIGIMWEMVPHQTKLLLDDVRFQIKNKSYVFDELAARFHHRLVSIHPFPNGNGRHARLMRDILLATHGHARFTWGRVNLTASNDFRKRYIIALQSADQRHYRLLLDFVRS